MGRYTRFIDFFQKKNYFILRKPSTLNLSYYIQNLYQKQYLEKHFFYVFSLYVQLYTAYFGNFVEPSQFICAPNHVLVYIDGRALFIGFSI